VSGKAHEMIKKLIDQRSKGNAVVANMVKTKLLLKGIKTDAWTSSTADDPAVIARIRAIAAEMGHAV
jgi:hypothetical protein